MAICVAWQFMLFMGHFTVNCTPLDAQLSHIDVPFPIFILPYDTYKFVIHLSTLSYSVYEIQMSEYLIIWLTSACLQEYCLRFGVHGSLFFIQAN